MTMTTLAKIREQAALVPDREAYRAGEDFVTYGSLWTRAVQAARMFRRLSRSSGSGTEACPLAGPAPILPILLDGSKSPDAAVAIVACLLAGIPYAPVAPSMPEVLIVCEIFYDLL